MRRRVERERGECRQRVVVRRGKKKGEGEGKIEREGVCIFFNFCQVNTKSFTRAVVKV